MRWWFKTRRLLSCFVKICLILFFQVWGIACINWAHWKNMSLSRKNSSFKTCSTVKFEKNFLKKLKLILLILFWSRTSWLSIMIFRICPWKAVFFSKFKKNFVDFSLSSYHVHLLLAFLPSTNFPYISSSSYLISLYYLIFLYIYK